MPRPKCNWCRYRALRRQAHLNGKVITRVWDPQRTGFNFYIHHRSEPVANMPEEKRRQYWVAYFMRFRKRCWCADIPKTSIPDEEID